jgi:hypothetical protein
MRKHSSPAFNLTYPGQNSNNIFRTVVDVCFHYFGVLYLKFLKLGTVVRAERSESSEPMPTICMYSPSAGMVKARAADPSIANCHKRTLWRQIYVQGVDMRVFVSPCVTAPRPGGGRGQVVSSKGQE